MTQYLPVLVCALLAMIIGGIWYGPIFGKTWARILGADMSDPVARKKMEGSAWPLYALQFVLTLIQLYVLAHLVGYSAATGIKVAMLLWAAFVMPTTAAASMWNNESRNAAISRFCIQAGYQLICFAAFGAILAVWH